MTDFVWPEDNFNSVRKDLGAHVSKRTEYVQRNFDKKWVRWELVDTQTKERDPFQTGCNTREVWIATGVWHDKPVTTMNKERQRWKGRQK